MKLTLLGTGNALVTKCYNTCFILDDGGKCLLVDGGGGNTVLRQIKRAGYEYSDIHDIFVTHKHIDHILGIVWLVRIICQSMARGTYEGDCAIYGHGEVLGLILDMCEKLLQAKQTKLIGKRVHLIEVRDGETREIIGHDVTFFDIHSTKAKQFGFSMTLDGGAKLTCCGDEPFSEFERPYAEGSAWLLHEAFCLDGQADIYKPYEKNHSTVKDACELAEGLGVPNLVLYHTEDDNLENRKSLYVAEGARYYRGNLFIPDDLECIEL